MRNHPLKSCGKRHACCKLCNPEQGEKISASLTGYTKSPKHQARISANIIKNHLGLQIKGGRAYVRLFTGWVKRAHAVWVQRHGRAPIPGFGRQGHHFVIHHKDEDKLNDSPRNLELKTASNHRSHHNCKRGY